MRLTCKIWLLKVIVISFFCIEYDVNLILIGQILMSGVIQYAGINLLCFLQLSSFLANILLSLLVGMAL